MPTAVKPAESMRISLRAVVYRENGHWIAHCLEMDIVADAKTASQALRDLLDLCGLQIRVAWEEGDIDSVFRPAPAHVMRMFFMGRPMTAPRQRAHPVTSMEARGFDVV